MRSKTTDQFHKMFNSLPAQVQRNARTAYKLFRLNPYHPSLHFKRVSPSRPIYSARIGSSYRVVGIRRDHDIIVWFWIGPHADYDKLLKQLR